MSVEEAAELARRAIYHATFRDGASGGVASGTLSFSIYLYICVCVCDCDLMRSSCFSVLCGINWMEETVW